MTTYGAYRMFEATLTHINFNKSNLIESVPVLK